MTPEFSRPVDARRLSSQLLNLRASKAECAALATRFGLLAIERLEAEIALARHGEAVVADGRLDAAIVQSCAVSGEPLAVVIDEPIALRFVPAGPPGHADEEIELAAEDCDEIEFSGGTIDVGEAVAQTLALAIDPYATGPEAEAARASHRLTGEEAAGPFAALAKLREQ